MEEPKFNKLLLVPIITMVALMLKLGAGYELPNAYVDVFADGILAVVTLIGQFMHPVK